LDPELNHRWKEAIEAPVSLPIACLAAPVLLGMMLKLAALPPLQSMADGPSTVFWVAAMA